MITNNHTAAFQSTPLYAAAERKILEDAARDEIRAERVHRTGRNIYENRCEHDHILMELHQIESRIPQST